MAADNVADDETRINLFHGAGQPGFRNLSVHPRQETTGLAEPDFRTSQWQELHMLP
jgi:hypothetical protein